MLDDILSIKRSFFQKITNDARDIDFVVLRKKLTSEIYDTVGSINDEFEEKIGNFFHEWNILTGKTLKRFGFQPCEWMT